MPDRLDYNIWTPMCWHNQWMFITTDFDNLPYPKDYYYYSIRGADDNPFDPCGLEKGLICVNRCAYIISQEELQVDWLGKEQDYIILNEADEDFIREAIGIHERNY